MNGSCPGRRHLPENQSKESQARLGTIAIPTLCNYEVPAAVVTMPEWPCPLYVFQRINKEQIMLTSFAKQEGDEIIVCIMATAGACPQGLQPLHEHWQERPIHACNVCPALRYTKLTLFKYTAA